MVKHVSDILSNGKDSVIDKIPSMLAQKYVIGQVVTRPQLSEQKYRHYNFEPLIHYKWKHCKSCISKAQLLPQYKQFI